MLFVVDRSLAEVLDASSRPHQAIVDAVSNLALARREGKHLLFADRETLRACAESPWLSERAHRVYSHLLNNLPQMKTYLENLSRRVEILAQDGVIESRTEAGCTVIRISASYLSDSSVVQTSVLLCENLTDTRFYRQLGEVWRHWSKLGNVIIRCEPHGGGGQTTADEYESIRSSGSRLCLCIVESDRTTPSDDLGSTAKMALDVHTSGVQPLCELFVLSARAVENIIPTGMYQEAVWGDNARMAGVLFLEDLESSEFGGARLYLDMKGGLRLGEILHAPEESAFREYWEPVAERSRATARDVDPGCWVDPRCNSRRDCRCIVAQGMGESILEHVTDFLESKSNQKKAEMVREPLKGTWESMGELIVAWCSGSSPLYAV
jgi:hypothetical protein